MGIQPDFYPMFLTVSVTNKNKDIPHFLFYPHYPHPALLIL
jgi:hypothetical protein